MCVYVCAVSTVYSEYNTVCVCVCVRAVGVQHVCLCVLQGQDARGLGEGVVLGAP